MDSSSIFIVFLLLLPLLSNCQSLVDCDFDYGQNCLPGLRTASFVLLNESTIDEDPPRQPPSDVSAIELFNDDGECSFPFLFGSISMYFCVKTDLDLPATCPIKDGNGTKRNCSEGEYGYELFEDGEIGSREYQLDLDNQVEQIGEHCFGIDYFLSDGDSLGKIFVIIEDEFNQINQTILQAQQREENRWHRIHQTFNIENPNPKFYIGFERGRRFPSDSDLPFYLAIDRIRLLDVPCGPGTTTTTTTTTRTQTSVPTTSSTVTSTSSSTTRTTPGTSSRTTSTSSTSSTSVSNARTTTTTTTSSTVLMTTATSSSSISIRWNVLLSILSLLTLLFD